MNSFANSLFSLLFGWLRSLIQGIWTAAARGEFSRFFTWLGDHWFLVAVVLCLGCTVLDYLVWLVRWRPYLVWRTKLRSFIRRLRGEKVDSQRRFSQGYAEAVPLDMPEAEFPAPPVYNWEEQEAAFHQAPTQLPPQAEAFPLPAEAVVPSGAPLPQEAEGIPQQHRYFVQPEGYQPPPVYIPSRADSAFSSDMPAARRRRRSEKYDRRRTSWHERLISSAEDEEALLDGLPPAVDREDAFREPVYPQRGPQGYDAWQRPQKHTDGTTS